MPRRNVGDFAGASIDAINMANAMQTLAFEHIRETFYKGDDELDLNNLSYYSFMRKFIESEESGQREEFEAQLGAQLATLQQQILQQAQQPPTGTP